MSYLAPSWVRVTGYDLQPGHAERAIKNESIRTSAPFKKACDAVNLKHTTRQASKWRRKTGLAWQEGRRPQPSH